MRAGTPRRIEAGSGSASAVVPLVDLFANILLCLLANSPEFMAKVVSLPRWDNGASVAAQAENCHQVLIDPSGKLFFDGVEVSRPQLAERFREAFRKQASVQIALDRSVPFETFWDTYAAYWEAGFSKPPQLRVRSALPDRPAQPSSPAR
jgi:biopolymer transport protein ExbD